jgi:hypothetical protein
MLLPLLPAVRSGFELPQAFCLTGCRLPVYMLCLSANAFGRSLTVCIK